MTNTLTHAIAIGRSPDADRSARVTEWSPWSRSWCCHRVRQRCQPCSAGVQGDRGDRGAASHSAFAGAAWGAAPAGTGVLALLWCARPAGGPLGWLRDADLPASRCGLVDDPLDLRTATFAAVATLLTVLLAGLAPALTASRGDLNDVPWSGLRGNCPTSSPVPPWIAPAPDRALDASRGRGALRAESAQRAQSRPGLRPARPADRQPGARAPALRSRAAATASSRVVSRRLFRAYQG